MRKKQGCCYGCCHPIAKEFQKQKFSLKHQPTDDFCKSQWQQHDRSWWFLIYRYGLAFCFALGVFGSVVQQFNEGLWFIYLTDWGFFLCMYTSLYGVILVTIYHFKLHQFQPGSWVLKVYWASYWSTLVLATLISLVYWAVLFPFSDFKAAGLYNLWAHAFNSILMILDLMLVAFPTHLLHFIYPFTLGMIYLLFTLIYYFAGGVDVNGNHYIYPILDWSRPGIAVGTVFICVILVIIFCFILFGLYKLRVLIYKKTRKSVMSITA